MLYVVVLALLLVAAAGALFIWAYPRHPHHSRHTPHRGA